MLLSAPLEVARTNACTSAPSSTSASVRCEPMNPSAPVTSTVRPAYASPSSERSSSKASSVQDVSLTRARVLARPARTVTIPGPCRPRSKTPAPARPRRRAAAAARRPRAASTPRGSAVARFAVRERTIDGLAISGGHVGHLHYLSELADGTREHVLLAELKRACRPGSTVLEAGRAHRLPHAAGCPCGRPGGRGRRLRGEPDHDPGAGAEPAPERPGRPGRGRPARARRRRGDEPLRRPRERRREQLLRRPRHGRSRSRSRPSTRGSRRTTGCHRSRR